MDPDKYFEELIKQIDDTVMPIPNIEYEPFTLIAKVRKHYYNYLIKLLTTNYVKACKIATNNAQLPSGIWKCAYLLELDAARSSMILNLYRNNIIIAVRKLKRSTNKGKLFGPLTDSLLAAKMNNKVAQVNFEKLRGPKCSCRCTCNNAAAKVDVETQCSQVQFDDYKSYDEFKGIARPDPAPDLIENHQPFDMMDINKTEDDQLIMELEQMFGTESCQQEDDLFEGIFCNDIDIPKKTMDKTVEMTNSFNIGTDQSKEYFVPAVNEQNEKIKSLDERLAALESIGPLQAKFNENPPTPSAKSKPVVGRKWLCEVYYNRLKLFDKLDEIRDKNRKKYDRIKGRYLDLFGEDTDDEEIMSPMSDTAEFERSCQERIAPWVVTSLTPSYSRRRIKSKTLFKGTARHLLKLIYKCNKFPTEYEVTSFVGDFLKNHPKISCESDYMSFHIPNFR